MTTFLLVSQFVLAVIITIAVLLQKSSSIGLGAYSGSNESLFGAKGPAGFLAKFTAMMGLVFVINALALGYLYQKESKRSVLDSLKTEQIAPKIPQSEPNKADIPTAPKAPSAPKN